MCTSSKIVKDRQSGIRRELDRRGYSMKVVAGDSGIEYGTLLTYFPANRDKIPTQIPGGAIYALAGAIPSDLLSLLLPDGFQIVEASEDFDHEEVARIFHKYLAAKTAAHHPDSPDGPAISECEDLVLKSIHAPLKAVAS